MLKIFLREKYSACYVKEYCYNNEVPLDELINFNKYSLQHLDRSTTVVLNDLLWRHPGTY